MRVRGTVEREKGNKKREKGWVKGVMGERRETTRPLQSLLLLLLVAPALLWAENTGLGRARDTGADTDTATTLHTTIPHYIHVVLRST